LTKYAIYFFKDVYEELLNSGSNLQLSRKNKNSSSQEKTKLPALQNRIFFIRLQQDLEPKPESESRIRIPNPNLEPISGTEP
jgi:hypothetical protein